MPLAALGLTRLRYSRGLLHLLCIKKAPTQTCRGFLASNLWCLLHYYAAHNFGAFHGEVQVVNTGGDVTHVEAYFRAGQGTGQHRLAEGVGERSYTAFGSQRQRQLEATRSRDRVHLHLSSQGLGGRSQRSSSGLELQREAAYSRSAGQREAVAAASGQHRAGAGQGVAQRYRSASGQVGQLSGFQHVGAGSRSIYRQRHDYRAAQYGQAVDGQQAAAGAGSQVQARGVGQLLSIEASVEASGSALFEVHVGFVAQRVGGVAQVELHQGLGSVALEYVLASRGY